VTYVLDGNAIAGDLFAAFGHEMTTVVGRCRNCGTASPVAELCVYARAGHGRPLFHLSCRRHGAGHDRR